MFAGPKCSSTADAAHVCAIYACMCQRRARENDFHWVNPASPPRAHFFQLHFISLCARGNGAINKNRRARRKKESERESQAERRGEEEAIREPSESTKVLFRARLANCFLFGSAGEAGKSEREKELARCGWGLWTARSSFSKPFRASVNTRAHTHVCVSAIASEWWTYFGGVRTEEDATRDIASVVGNCTLVCVSKCGGKAFDVTLFLINISDTNNEWWLFNVLMNRRRFSPVCYLPENHKNVVIKRQQV